MCSRNILVVDDYAPFRRLVCSLLQQSADFQVAEASDGLQAVQKAEQLQPDLILLDIGLPILNGIQVAERLSSARRILFLSQESSPDVVQEALRLSSGYVHKPCAQSDLLPAIQAVLEGKRFVSSGLEREEDRDFQDSAQEHIHSSNRASRTAAGMWDRSTGRR